MTTGGEGHPPDQPGAQAHPDDQLIGELVAGKYQVLRKLGAGGMGAVYEAEQQPLGRRVALKVIKRALTDEPMAVKRFINEARSVAQLNHNNIVTIHDFGAVDGGEPTAGKALYIAMELLEGRDLRDEILHRQRIDWRRSCRIVAEVARALAEAHTRGIVHRDLKPDNVMLIGAPGDEVRLKVVDFGVAKLLPEHGGTAGMTGTGMVVGTPGYISPEQINGIGDDPRSDLYALGVMWFEMLAGFSPYDAETPVKLVLKHLTDPVPSVTSALPQVDIPEGVELIVRSLMAKEPDDRPANAVLLINEVERLLNDDTGLAPHQATEAAVPAAAIAQAASTPGASALPAGSNAPHRGGSAASFPRPASAGGGALSPSAATPVTGQALPSPVTSSPVDAAPVVAADKRGCLSTFLMGCGALVMLSMAGTFACGVLGVAFGDEEAEDVFESEADGDVEETGAPEPPSPPAAVEVDGEETGEAPRKKRRERNRRKRRNTKRAEAPATPAPPQPPATPAGRSLTDKLSIAHPPGGKNKYAYEAYTMATKHRPARVYNAVKKLLKGQGVLRSAQTLNGYYEHNGRRLAPGSPAAERLEDANELVFEQYGRAMEKQMPGMLESLGEGDVDWLGLPDDDGSKGSAP